MYVRDDLLRDLDAASLLLAETCRYSVEATNTALHERIGLVTELVTSGARLRRTGWT
jgi:hypothetical protein